MRTAAASSLTKLLSSLMLCFIEITSRSNFSILCSRSTCRALWREDSSSQLKGHGASSWIPESAREMTSPKLNSWAPREEMLSFCAGKSRFLGVDDAKRPATARPRFDLGRELKSSFPDGIGDLNEDCCDGDFKPPANFASECLLAAKLVDGAGSAGGWCLMNLTGFKVTPK